MALSKAEQEELAQLENEFGSKKLSPDEEKELAALEKEFGGKKNSPSIGDTVLEQFGKGVPVIGSYLPELQAKAAPAIYGLLNKITGQDVQPDSYIQERDANVARQIEQEKEHPYVSLASNLAGGISGGAALPAINSVKGAAKLGGLIGGLSNPGSIKGEESGLQLEDRLKNSLFGAGTGAAVQSAIQAPGYLSDKFKSSAETSAFKSLGPYSREARKAMAKDQVNAIGRDLLDENVIGKIPANYGTLEQRASSKAGDVGKELEDFLGALDKDAARLGVGVNKKEVAMRAAENLINPEETIPGVTGKNERVWAALKEFVPDETSSDNVLGLMKAENLKRGIGKEINWDRLPGTEIPHSEEINRVLYNQTKKAAEDAAQRTEEKVFGEGTNVFKSLKDKYENLKTASEIAAKRDANTLANRMISPSDYMTSIGGGLLGAAAGESPEDKIKYGLIGAGVGGVNKLGRLYGNQASAVLKDAVAKGFDKIDKNKLFEAIKDNPKLLQGLIRYSEPVGY